MPGDKKNKKSKRLKHACLFNVWQCQLRQQKQEILLHMKTLLCKLSALEAYLFQIEYNHQQAQRPVKMSGTCKGKHERHIYPPIYVSICTKQ